MTQSGHSAACLCARTSIALTHKIHTLSTLQSEMLGVLSNIDFFRNWAVPVVQLGCGGASCRWSVFCDHGGMSAAARFQFFGSGLVDNLCAVSLYARAAMTILGRFSAQQPCGLTDTGPSPGASPGAEITVDVITRQAGVGQGTPSRPTSSRGSPVKRCRSGSVGNSLSRTGRARAAILAPKSS